MRGSQTPAVQPKSTDSQLAFRALSRHRRSKLARVAHTTLLKADQWGRGGAIPSDLASTLDAAVRAFQAKGAKK